jgi:hypothetical protein
MRAFTSSHNAVWRFCAANLGGLSIKVGAGGGFGARNRRALSLTTAARLTFSRLSSSGLQWADRINHFALELPRIRHPWEVNHPLEVHLRADFF